ncbi:Mu-like prophage major head subunit gpT family protein [Thermodesulforhabdus norvegica]|uniref:Mu-like prophage major head subunit gpT n=1 Tax=Thermodesulforhabdus norvegica TaxID=39841 RepID=A0A1I4SV79_9BACT|nr:Mu-like prophage major head subunit gpT family protein [Thermodesulforhabdus norvegica]SFM68193.1 Mu-like prophage major head subunit gpT [Thermodesulforhabdus norvegica]
MVINQQTLQAIYVNFKTIFKQRLEITETFWERIATRVPSTTKQNDYKWLGSFPMLREWIGERQVRNLAAYDYSIKNKNFESTVGIDRDDIEDDNLGVYVPMIEQLADSAKKHPDMLVFGLLKNGFTEKCYDGKPFFSDQHKIGKTTYSNFQDGTGNPWFLLDVTKPLKPLIVQIRREPEFQAMDSPDDYNVFTRREFLYGVDYRGNAGYGFWQQAFGSKADLTVDNYKAARAAMQSYKNEEGVPLDIRPSLLVVGPSNEAAAREILSSEQINGSTNVWRGTADLLVVPWLD